MADTDARTSLLTPDSPAASVGAQSIAHLFGRALGLVRGLLLAWLLPPSEYGLLGVALLALNVLLPVACLGLHEGIARYAPHHEGRRTFPLFLRRASVLVLVGAAACGAVLVAASPTIGPVFFSGPAEAEQGPSTPAAAAVVRWTALCLLSLAPYHAMLGLLRGLRMFRAGAVAELVAAILFTLFAVAAPLLGAADAEGVLASYALANALTLVGAVRPLLRAVTAARRPMDAAPQRTERLIPPSPPTASPSIVRTLLRYSVWIAGTAILWHGLAWYPTWHLLKITDASSVASLHAARTIAQLAQVAAVMLVAVVSAHVTRTWEDARREHALEMLGRMGRLTLIGLLCLTSALLLAHPLLMRLLPREVIVSADVFAPLLVFHVLIGVSGLLAIPLQLHERPRTIFVSFLVGTVVMLVVSAVWLGDPSRPGELDAALAQRRAAWCGMLGIIATCGVLGSMLARRGCAPGSRVALLALAQLAPLSGSWGTAGATVVVLLLAWRTDWLLSAGERLGLRDVLSRGGREAGSNQAAPKNLPPQG